MRHILLDPGMLPLDRLKSSFKAFSQNNTLTLIIDERLEKKITKANFGCEILYYDDFTSMKNNDLNDTYSLKYSEVLNIVLNDQRTSLIAERVHNIFAWNSLFSLTSIIEKIVFNSLVYFQENKIDSMFFQATPHNLPNWVMAKVAEVLGIPVRMIQTSPLPWRYWVVEGLDAQKQIFPLEVAIKDFDINLLNNFIKLNEADYTKALPEYEKKRLESRKGKLWSWKKEIKDALRHPKFAVNLPTKRKLFKLYDSLSVKPDLNKKYLVFFLHFQPERTSLPEGLGFSNQWFIIRMISKTLPKGWKLIVKEHPSTYLNYLDFRYRSSKFYKDISVLGNVELAKLDFDTFNLIDKSQGIVTITGTVGVQALIRNKPVLVFGVASYRNNESVYFIKSMKDLIDVFLQISDKDNSEFSNKNAEWLHQVNSFSINGILHKDVDEKINFYKQEYRVEGHLRLIKLLLKSNL
jgi:hypothetical protein